MSKKHYINSILTYEPKTSCLDTPKLATLIRYNVTNSLVPVLPNLTIGSNYVTVIDLVGVRSTSSRNCKRLVTLKVLYSNINCLNRPYYHGNTLRRVTSLPRSILNLEITGTLVNRVPIGFFKLLAMSATNVITQQKTRESVIRVDQWGVINRQRNNGSVNKKRLPFMPKSTNELVLCFHVSSTKLLELGVRNDFIHNGVYKKLTMKTN